MLLACLTVVLAFPYLSAHEVQVASRAEATNPSVALNDLRRAAQLNPLSSDPGRLAGAIALRNGRWTLAVRQFRESIKAEPGGWFSWLGAGLAESALGEPEQAHRDFVMARRINARQPAVQAALQRVFTKTPLTSDEIARCSPARGNWVGERAVSNCRGNRWRVAEKVLTVLRDTILSCLPPTPPTPHEKFNSGSSGQCQASNACFSL